VIDEGKGKKLTVDQDKLKKTIRKINKDASETHRIVSLCLDFIVFYSTYLGSSLS